MELSSRQLLFTIIAVSALAAVVVYLLGGTPQPEAYNPFATLAGAGAFASLLWGKGR